MIKGQDIFNYRHKKKGEKEFRVNLVYFIKTSGTRVDQN